MLPSTSESEVKYGRNNEEEGERLDFDSGDEVPEADRQAPGAPSAGDAGADATSGSSGESSGGPGPQTHPPPHLPAYWRPAGEGVLFLRCLKALHADSADSRPWTVLHDFRLLELPSVYILEGAGIPVF